MRSPTTIARRSTTRRSVIVTAVALAVAPALAATACTGPTEPPRPTSAHHAVGAGPATTHRATAARPPRWRATLTDDPKKPSLAPGWSSAAVTRVGSSFLAWGGRDAIAFDEQGHQLWRHTFAWSRWHHDEFGPDPARLDASAGVAILQYDRATDPSGKHQEHVVEALNPLTGKGIWQQAMERDAMVRVTPTTVYLTLCRVENDHRTDDCRLSARDPRTGHQRWISGTNGPAPAVVAESGSIAAVTSGPELRTLAVSDGHPIGPRLAGSRSGDTSRRTLSYEGMVGSTVVLGRSLEKGDPCSVEWEGLDPRTGKRRWHRYLLGVRNVKDPASTSGRLTCLATPRSSAGGRLPGEDSVGRPIVTDLRDGSTTWHGPQPGKIVAVGERDVLVAIGEKTLILYALDTGDARWSMPIPTSLNVGAWSFVGSRLVSTSRRPGCGDGDGCVDVYDLATKARRLTAPGTLAGSGPGWLVTSTPGATNGTTLALYSIG